jgi:hypothetical protein
LASLLPPITCPKSGRPSRSDSQSPGFLPAHFARNKLLALAKRYKPLTIMLEKGITGFWSIKDKSLNHPPSSFINEIAQRLWQSNLITNLEIESPGPDNNYHTVKIWTQKNGLSILINSVHPYYCGTSFDSSWMHLDFIEVPVEIQNAIGNDLKYLEPSFLNQNLKPEHIKDLAPAELDQVNYWKSKTVGEVIFNGYD